MALVVFLRGVNVGGHRRFRPAVLAAQLREFDVVNIGATGTFIVRKPGSRHRFRAALARRMPFAAAIAICEGSEIAGLQAQSPFADETSAAHVTRFVSILPQPLRRRTSFPIALPSHGDWLVRIVGARKQFVFGEYRRDMKTIGYLGQIDKLFGAPATTRTWGTIASIVRILNGADLERSNNRRARR